eukprot:SAG11_NODE_12033_length_725_cov_0.982428_2_plen_69_part_00
MGMQSFTLEELGLFLGVAGAAIGACVIGVLSQVQKSKCRTVKCCCLERERTAELTDHTGEGLQLERAP